MKQPLPKLTIRTALLPVLGLAISFTLGCKQDPASTDGAGTSAGQGTDVTHVDAIAASQLLAENAEIVVLDVRTPQEYAAGHLPGAPINVDFKAADFKEAAGKLARETPYLVHCRSGARSTASLAVFKELGFKKIYHLDGGFNAWKEAGEAVEK